MPAHLDAPGSTTPVDPLTFQIRGWLWLDTLHTQTAIASLEAHTTAPDGTDVLLGFTSTLYARPDVTAALSLPPTAFTGFEFFCHHLQKAGVKQRCVGVVQPAEAGDITKQQRLDRAAGAGRVGRTPWPRQRHGGLRHGHA